MCTMHERSASVNQESHQTFDVMGFDHLGQPQMTVGENLPLQAAISRSLGFNANPGRLIAAVVPSGSEKLGNLHSETTSEPVDASSDLNDSDAIEDAEDAGESESRVRPDDGAVKRWELCDLIDDYTRLPAIGLQSGLLRHLDLVIKAIHEDKIDCVAHVGMVCRSLERFVCQCIERQQPEWRFNEWRWTSDEFDAGNNGGCTDPVLDEALNSQLDEALQRDWPELFEEHTATGGDV